MNSCAEAQPIGAVSSGVEHYLDTEEVTSSNLVSPTTNYEVNGLGGWPLFFGEQNREQNVSKTAPKPCSSPHLAGI